MEQNEARGIGGEAHGARGAHELHNHGTCEEVDVGYYVLSVPGTSPFMYLNVPSGGTTETFTQVPAMVAAFSTPPSSFTIDPYASGTGPQPPPGSPSFTVPTGSWGRRQVSPAYSGIAYAALSETGSVLWVVSFEINFTENLITTIHWYNPNPANISIPASSSLSHVTGNFPGDCYQMILTITT